MRTERTSKENAIGVFQETLYLGVGHCCSQNDTFVYAASRRKIIIKIPIGENGIGDVW